MMAWCYWHGGRVDDARAVDRARRRQPRDGRDPLPAGARRRRGHRRRRAASRAERRPARRARDARALRTRPPARARADARVAVGGGGQRPLADRHAARDGPHRAGARALRGAGCGELGAVWLHAIVGVEILIDLRRTDDARRALLRARELIGASGSLVYDMLSLRDGGQARAAPRTRRRTPRWRCSTASSAARPLGAYGFIAEQVDMWAGYAVSAARARTPRRSAGCATPWRGCWPATASSSCPRRPSTSPRPSGVAATRTPPTARPTSRWPPRPSRAPTTSCCRRSPTSRRWSRGASTPSPTRSRPGTTSAARCWPRASWSIPARAAGRARGVRVQGPGGQRRRRYARGSPRRTSCWPIWPAARAQCASRERAARRAVRRTLRRVHARLPAPGLPPAARGAPRRRGAHHRKRARRPARGPRHP